MWIHYITLSFILRVGNISRREEPAEVLLQTGPASASAGAVCLPKRLKLLPCLKRSVVKPSAVSNSRCSRWSLLHSNHSFTVATSEPSTHTHTLHEATLYRFYVFWICWLRAASQSESLYVVSRVTRPSSDAENLSSLAFLYRVTFCPLGQRVSRSVGCTASVSDINIVF